MKCVKENFGQEAALRFVIHPLPRHRDMGANIYSNYQYCLCFQLRVGSLERVRWTAYEKFKMFEWELIKRYVCVDHVVYAFI